MPDLTLDALICNLVDQTGASYSALATLIDLIVDADVNAAGAYDNADDFHHGKYAGMKEAYLNALKILGAFSGTVIDTVRAARRER